MSPGPHDRRPLSGLVEIPPGEEHKTLATCERVWTALVAQGVTLLSPPTDQAFGHRTLFFRDPDGNLLEVFAEI